MKIAVLVNYVPFAAATSASRGEALVTILKQHGQQAILLRIPFSLSTAEKAVESLLVCRLLQIPNVDRVIGLEFPAYLVPHPNKILWLDAESPEQLPLAEAGRFYVTSQLSANRLKRQHGIIADVLQENSPDIAKRLIA